MNNKEFISALNKENIICSKEQIDLLEKTIINTIETNKLFNLTSITNEDEFREKMIFDSLLGIKLIEKENQKCIDVGTGAGFPGLPLAIINPKNNYVLLDATKKKIDFIKQFVEKENINNVIAINDRVENYAKNNRETFDYAFARAVSSLPILLETIIPLLKVDGKFIAYKAKNIKEELKQSVGCLKKLNCTVELLQFETLPCSKEERCLLVIKKEKVTNLKYPRDYSLIVQKPLK